MIQDHGSAMQLYRQAGSQGVPANTGLGMALRNQDRADYERTKYSAPLHMAEGAAVPGAKPGLDIGAGAAPEYYNYNAPPPAKYDVPTPQKERMVARQAIRDAVTETAAASPAVPRPDPITDEEVDYLQTMMSQAKLADFDMYVNSFVDPRKPGNMKWLMGVYPEFVNRRLQQVHTDYEFALRNQLIDQWGINTFDDLHFKYLVDQGVIKGPSLRNEVTKADLEAGYSAGYLSPYNPRFHDMRVGGVKLPFSSARFGRRPVASNEGRTAWSIGNSYPLGQDRSYINMATEMYNPRRRRGGENNLQTLSEGRRLTQNTNQEADRIGF